MFEFFPQDLFLFFSFKNVIFYWCDILHCLMYFKKKIVILCVRVCMCACVYVCLCCLESLNTTCFTIIRLEATLLLAYIKLAFLFC